MDMGTRCQRFRPGQFDSGFTLVWRPAAVSVSMASWLGKTAEKVASESPQESRRAEA